jgi:uncharacterized protein
MKFNFKMVILLLLSSVIPFGGWAQDTDYTQEIMAHRQKQEATFRTLGEGPLSAEQIAQFTGLQYFSIDPAFRVEARLIRFENPTFFFMATTTDRRPTYHKYGELHFHLKGKSLVLEVYKNPELSRRPGYEDYLFIPFTDLTNGHQTYEIGRYLEFREGQLYGPESDRVLLDFNLAYNPYCQYSPNYSCPIPPEANALPIKIEAGEKKYIP